MQFQHFRFDWGQGIPSQTTVLQPHEIKPRTMKTHSIWSKPCAIETLRPSSPQRRRQSCCRRGTLTTSLFAEPSWILRMVTMKTWVCFVAAASSTSIYPARFYFVDWPKAPLRPLAAFHVRPDINMPAPPTRAFPPRDFYKLSACTKIIFQTSIEHLPACKQGKVKVKILCTYMCVDNFLCNTLEPPSRAPIHPMWPKCYEKWWRQAEECCSL